MAHFTRFTPWMRLRPTLWWHLSSLLLLLAIGTTGQAQITRQGFLQEGFESTTFPPAGWQTRNVSGSNQWQRTTAQAWRGSASAFMQYQTTAAEDWLILPRFLITSGDSLTFRLRLAFKGYPPDQLSIMVSTTDSATSSFTTTLRTLSEGGTAPDNYPANATTWARYGVRLTAYAGQKIYVALRHNNNNGDGIYIDNVELGTRPAADVAMTSIVLPSAVGPGTAYTPQASLINNGSQAQTVPVTLTIGAYSSTRTATALAPGASTTLTFDPWTPPAVGTYTATATAALSGDATPADNQITKTVQAYGGLPNASGAKWRAGTAMPAGRWAHGLAGSEKPALATTPSPTYVYAVSGGNTSFANDASVVRFDPSTSTWSSRAALPVARTHPAVQWLNGKLYVAGGYTGSFTPTTRLDIYDPVADTWSTGAAMPTAVGDCASGVYKDSLLYLVGGYTGSADVTTVQVYNPTTNTWTTGTAFAGTASAGLRGSIVGNKMVVVGGYSQSLASELSQAWQGTINPASPASITWSALPAYPGGNTGRLAAGTVPQAAVPRVYFAGGDPNGQGTATLDASWAYDLDLNTWQLAPSLLQGVSNVLGLAPMVQQDSVYLVCTGGFNGSSVIATTQRLNLGHISAVLSQGDLLINTAMTVPGGVYRNVTVTSTGDGTVTGPLASFGTVRVQAGGRLRLNAPLTGSASFEVEPDATLAVADAAGLSASGATGAVRVTGSRVLSPGATYAYVGSTAQQTGTGLPAQVRNLTIANAAGVTLSQATAVERVLRCESGVLSTDASTGRTLTLLSDPATTATALVAAVGGSVGGNGGVLQRTLDPTPNTAGEGYRHYSSPVSSLTVGALAQPGFAPVTNPAYNSAAQPGLTVPFPSIFTYDEARVTAAMPDFEAGYASPASSSSGLPVGQGFSLHVPNWLRVDFKGTFNTGTISRSNLTRGTEAQSGWHLLGNPYPAPLDWSLVTAADRPGLEAAVYVAQSTGSYTGRYRAYVNGLPAGSSPLIPAGQGFLVRTAAAGTPGTLTFRDAQRVTTWGTQPVFQRSSGPRPVVELSLSAPGTTAPLDVAYVYCEAGATTSFDPEFDAWQLPQAGTSLGLQAAGTAQPLAIAGLPELLPGTPETVVPLTITNAPTGPLTLPAGITDFPAGAGVFLRNQLTGALHNLTATPAFTVPAGSLPGQFALVLRPSAITATLAAASRPRLQVWPNPAHGRCLLAGPAGSTVTVLDALGRAVRTARLGSDGTASLDVTGLTAGVYVVRAAALATRLVLE